MGNNAKRIAIGTLIAGTMGYVAGILTAPKSGSETRGKIRQVSNSSILEAEKQLKKLHTELSDLLGEAETKTKHAKDAFPNKSQAVEGEIVAKASKTRQKARELLSALHDGDADDRDLDKAVLEATKAIQSIRRFLKK